MSLPGSQPALVAPTKEQVEWLQAEVGVIIHFDVQVFENSYNWRDQWGYTPAPSVFNPAELDTDQWIETAKNAGAKYAILVAKHCSGFSLWPTKAHDYSVAATPWRDGKGDLVAEFVASCEKYGLKPGLYCSASANAYLRVENPGLVVGGTDEDNAKYNETVILQLTELWSNYGELFEVWFDGGVIPVEDGGPPVPALHATLQPGALALNAPYGTRNRVRNSGEEDGTAILPAWSTVHGAKPTRAGDPEGDEFMPIEADLANRNGLRAFQGGWFWQEGQDDTIYPITDFVDRYYKSVGRNSNYLIGMVIDNRGLVPEADKKSFETFGEVIRRITAIPRDTTAGSGDCFEMEITTGAPVSEALIMEDFSEGERIRRYRISALVDGAWGAVAEGECIGHKRLIEFPAVKAERVKLEVLESLGTPALIKFSVYNRIPLAKPPKIRRDENGRVSITSDADSVMYYTLDGSLPTEASTLYTEPFTETRSGHIRAMAIPVAGFDPAFPELEDSLTDELYFGVASIGWEVIHADSEYDQQNLKENVLLENGFPWISGKDTDCPHEITVDMKAPQVMTGFIYTPFWNPGHILRYNLYVGDAPDSVTTFVRSGNFPDIMNMPVQQVVNFDTSVTARYFRFVATANATGRRYASIGRMEMTTVDE